MIVVLDYDDTFTKDPETWVKVAAVFRKAGHKIIGCTMRCPNEAGGMLAQYDEVCDQVYFSSRQAKLPYLFSKGISPDIWIDDRPDFILNSAAPDPVIQYDQNYNEFKRMEKNQSEASREYTCGKLTIESK